MQLILSCRIYSSRWAFWEDNRSHSNLREELWQSTGNKGLSSVSEVTASRTMPSENIPHLEENPYQCLSNRDTISGATWQSIPLCNMECKMEFCSLSATTKARHLISIVLWPMTCLLDVRRFCWMSASQVGSRSWPLLGCWWLSSQCLTLRIVKQNWHSIEQEQFHKRICGIRPFRLAFFRFFCQFSKR